MKSEFRAIALADIPAMARLLISRQIREISAFPFLQNRSCSIEHAEAFLGKLLTKESAIGMAAFTGGQLAGYILGEIKDDPIRGRHIWASYEGLAVRENLSPELIRALYAAVSDLWLERGCFRHYILIPLGNRVYLEALQHLSFFIQQVHAVMDLAQYKPFALSSDVQVRIADKTDREKMGRLSGIIQAYQNAAPTFEPVLSEAAADIKAGYEGLVEDTDVTILLAERDGKELGFHLYGDAAPGLMSPDGGAELCVAGTYPSHMGSGIGKKLMNEGCALMGARGFRHLATDWRITNLASSTFWPKCGFLPIAYRMVRHIDANWSRMGS